MALLEGLNARLRAERERLGYSQEQLAAELGLAPKTLFNYESEGWSISLSYVHQLGALGADECFIIFGTARQPARTLRADARDAAFAWLEENGVTPEGEPIPLRELGPMFEMIYQHYLEAFEAEDAL